MMQIKVKYEKGVLKLLKKVKIFKEGQVLDLDVEPDMAKIAFATGFFDFLKDEEDLYTKEDVIENN
jgi:predicted DNA-binding antitoxin AbrB/MazE fold protein